MSASLSGESDGLRARASGPPRQARGWIFAASRMVLIGFEQIGDRFATVLASALRL